LYKINLHYTVYNIKIIIKFVFGENVGFGILKLADAFCVIGKFDELTI